MANALTITVDSNFDPTLPISLHSPGAGGYVNRYVASTLTGTAGSAVPSWEDHAGGVTLVPDNASQQPTLGLEGSQKYVAFDGVSNRLKGNLAAGAVKTIAMVVRPKAAEGVANYVLFCGDVLVQKHSTEAAAMLVAGAPAARTPVGSMQAGKWSIIVAVVDGGGSIVWANGQASPNTAATATGVTSRFAFGLDSGVAAPADVAELIGWPTALNASQCADVLAALRRQYASIL